MSALDDKARALCRCVACAKTGNRPGGCHMALISQGIRAGLQMALASLDASEADPRVSLMTAVQRMRDIR